jgi:hypothetical protein
MKEKMVEVILGLHDGHNAAAAILDKGRIVAAVQEERLTRIKNQGGIPHRAIDDLLAITINFRATNKTAHRLDSRLRGNDENPLRPRRQAPRTLLFGACSSFR